MKKLLQLLTTLGLVFLGTSLWGQNLEFTLRYNIPLARYEVYARPLSTNPTFTWGPSQISIVAPATVPDGAFAVTSVSAGAWLDNSQVHAPSVTPGFDYHGVGSLGAPTNLVANTEKLIFHFTIAGGCYDGLRLYINGSDPTSADAGMAGGDFSNTIVDGALNERYIGNYNNTGTLCNNPPTITSNGGGPTASVSVPENTTAVTTVVASDPEGDVMTYSISGGADAAKFTINPTTGVLTFITAPNFENPTDAGGNNVYDVQVKATDPGGLMDVQDIAVTVTNVNENPDITSNGGGPNASVSVPENTTAVTTVVATDPEAGAVTYSITGGADAAKFTIDPNTGALSFITAPDFENPTDVGLNNVYNVQVTATDPLGGTDVQSIAVTVTDVNEAPSITSDGGGATATIPVAENTTAVTTVTATDPENLYGTPKFSITGGADAAKFTINAATGALSFVTAPDFEVPTDANLDNNYVVTVRVTDAGGLFDEQTITVPVTNANENPDITSNGGGPNASVSVPENTTAVTTVVATDPEAGAITYSITGGADAAKFTIDPNTGALSFITAPDFENPTDVGLNNVYNVQVTATDPLGGTDVQSIAVTVTDVNEAPTITSDGGGATATIPVAENTTAVTTVTATDPENLYGTPKFSITGGADAAKFTINAATGALSFITAPDFEVPTDANLDNNYVVTVRVTDAGGLFDEQTITVPVTNANENPDITSNGGGPNASVSVPENTTAVTTVVASDPEAGAITYSITGGADAAKFTINATTGALSFVTAPDFENPTDVGLNNVYDVQVTATDPLGGTDVQSIAVTVTDVNEAPSITSNGGGATATIPVAENTTAVTTVTATDPENLYGTPKFSITGGADAAKFTINATTGALSFITAPNFESPTDANLDNTYEVTVRVTDAGGLFDEQVISVPVTNANENPDITSNGGGPSASVSIPENTTAVTTVVATDPDGNTVTYSITGGADAAKFTIDPNTGALSFITAPDFENPTDAGTNNVYDVVVTASDGNGGTDVQTIAVTVNNVNEAPSITSNGGGATATIPVAENTTAVTTVTATDPENLYGTPKFSITGGADAAKFTINANTGALSFITAPDFEVPTDANLDNNYLVQVTVTDAGGLTDVQDITVPVTNANDAPIITSNGGGASASVSIPENTTAVTTVVATDPDGNTITYSITGGADAAKFTIDPNTGALSFITAPDFENPTDAGANNVYDVVVTASDGNGGTDTQNIAVTVNNVNEAPSITSNGGGATASISIPENSTAVTTVTATDPENAYGTPKFSITGGADAALFTIDANTGVLTLISGRDFENPTDAGANNVYDVQVTVTDAGNLTDVQSIAVTITDVDENGRLRMKVLLQGALLGSATPGVMRDDLRANGYVPLNDPYTASGNPRFTHAGSGGAATTTSGVLNADAGTPDAIVDWVFVELRSSSNPSVVLETRAALVQRDGDVVSPVDGDSPLSFTNQAGTSYYVAVKHRNHLGVMTATAQTLTVGGTVVDFTTMSNANLFNNTGYDGAEMITIGSVKALWAGNANSDAKVKYQGPSNDNMTILNQVLTFPSNSGGAYNFDLALGYFNGDINMDGKVKYQGTNSDPAFIFSNLITNYTLNASDLYNYDLFIEQLP